ncbi:vascular endothelial growth factor C-like isoform X2 [Ambystoma mexicanum]|uniref:vascular endothelial growth factor C-like isoform X2 n=1 Tax=Ambystoma mexicanum TaxID=8296 RepID=UPI0037E968B0
MWAWLVLLGCSGLLHVLPQPYVDTELYPDPELDGAASQDQIELQRSRSTMRHPGGSKEAGDYNPFLRCLQRKQAQLHEQEEGNTPYSVPAFKKQKSNWVQGMKSVEAELARTVCRPREVCVQVSAENQASSSNTFYIPKCVTVHRCGGCCSREGSSCINTSQTSISKTLIEITIPPTQEPKLVSMMFLNHTDCGCTSPRTPLRSIIKRASVEAHLNNTRIIRSQYQPTAHSNGAGQSWCNRIHVSCSSGLSWNTRLCRCVEDPKASDLNGLGEGAAVCGAHMVFSEESCSCVCKTDIDSSSCGSLKVFSIESCRCICKNGLDRMSCGLYSVFSDDSCSCVCENGLDENSCGPHKVFNEDSCSCACKNGLDGSICGPHSVFIEDSCSCLCKNGHDNSSCGEPMLLQESTCSCVCPAHIQADSCKPDWGWDKEKCRCVCQKSCPNNKLLNMAICQCECKEQSTDCIRRGRKFDPHSSATGYPAQGGGHDVQATITTVALCAIASQIT